MADEGDRRTPVLGSAPDRPSPYAEDPATAPPFAGAPPGSEPGIAGPRRGVDEDLTPDPFPGTPADVVSEPGIRRFLRWELLVVLAIFPLPAVIAALVSAANHLLHSADRASHASNLVPGNAPVSVVLGVVLELSSVAAAALVWYLLARNGEGTTSIGLDRTRPRLDASLILPIFLVAYLASFFLGGLLQAALQLKTFPVSDPTNDLAYLPVLLAGGLAAGIVEETVVLGFLVRRLEQLGVRPVYVVAIAVVVRASYHLYYGPGVIPILVWATASVLFYRKVRRLAPFMIVHALWDMSLFLSAAISPWVLLVELGVVLVPTAVFAILWFPRRPRAARSANWAPPPPPSWSGS
jgi:membrane protease YdiL (CAAX protease family)